MTSSPVGNAALRLSATAGEGEFHAACGQMEYALKENILKIETFMLKNTDRALSSSRLSGSPAVQSLRKKIAKKIDLAKERESTYLKLEKKEKFKRALLSLVRKKATLVAIAAHTASAALSSPATSAELPTDPSSGRGAPDIEMVDKLSSAEKFVRAIFSPKAEHGSPKVEGAPFGSGPSSLSLRGSSGSIFSDLAHGKEPLKRRAFSEIHSRVERAVGKDVKDAFDAGVELVGAHAKGVQSRIARSLPL